MCCAQRGTSVPVTLSRLKKSMSSVLDSTQPPTNVPQTTATADHICLVRLLIRSKPLISSLAQAQSTFGERQVPFSVPTLCSVPQTHYSGIHSAPSTIPHSHDIPHNANNPNDAADPAHPPSRCNIALICRAPALLCNKAPLATTRAPGSLA